VAVYEPPFIVDDSRPPLPADYVQQLDRAVAEGRRGDAVTIFMTKAIGLPGEYLGGMRADPSWAGMEAVAHTLAYDGRVCGTTMSGNPLPAEFAGITAPTLAVAGGNSEQFMRDGGQALAKLLPDAEFVVLPGQDHAVQADALVPVLVPFFRG
jgi:pimeloyl-ACP methyl ester carboxylesterase